MYANREFYNESIWNHSVVEEVVDTVKTLETEATRVASLLDLKPKAVISLHNTQFNSISHGLFVERASIRGNVCALVLRSPGTPGSRSGDWNHPHFTVGLARQEATASGTGRVVFRKYGDIRYNRLARKKALTQAIAWADDIEKLVADVDAKLAEEDRERAEKKLKEEAERRAQKERACEFVDGKALIDFCTAGNRSAVDIVKRVQRMIEENRERVGLDA